MELPPYSAETENYIDWYKSTERRFGCAAAEPLLKDVQLCDEYIDISYAAKCVVANSLEDRAAAYLNTRYKTEKNLANFMKVLDDNFNQKIDERTRECNRWKGLFVLVLEKPDDCH